LNREEENVFVLEALFNPLFHSRTFRHVFTLNIDDESVVRMQVVFSVNVLIPWFVLDFELRFADSTNEADSLNFRCDIGRSRSFVCERVDDNTKEDVHENNVNDHEEGEIKPISEHIIFIRNVSLPKSISNTTSASHSETCCGH